MAPTFDTSAMMEDNRSPSPTGRHRSVSPDQGNRVEPIPEHSVAEMRVSPRTSPRKEEQDHTDGYRDQSWNNNGKAIIIVLML